MLLEANQKLTQTASCAKTVSVSTASALDVVILFLQRSHDDHDMVALHFNHTIFDRTARAAGSAQLFAQCGKRHHIKQQALDKRDAFATTAFGLQADAYNAIGGRYRLRFTCAGCDWLAACRAHSSAVG